MNQRHQATIFMLIGSLWSICLATNSNFSKCDPKNCGVVHDIGYPFWISGQQAEFCGYPDFKLDCLGSTLVLRLLGEEFNIRNIFNNNNSALILSTTFKSDVCSVLGANLTFNIPPFQISPFNKMLIFYYGCSATPPDSFRAGDCDGGEIFSSYLGGDFLMPKQLVSYPSCSGFSVVPVVGFRGADGSDYMELVKQGFLVEWAASLCPECKASGGKCGYDNGTAGYTCICPDRNHLRCCRKRSIGKIIIGVASGVGGFLIVCCSSIFFYMRRRKRNQPTASSIDRSSSFDSSSKKDPELGSIYPTQSFTYNELQEATDSFSEAKELGDGGFGTVYKGKLRDGRTVAVKRLYQNNCKRMEQFMNEIAILSRLRHQNLVTLYGCSSRHAHELLLVYEFVSNGTVADHLHGARAEEGTLTWCIRMNIAIETADALAYLHAIEPQIIHRDVKTNNILLDNNFHVKVADFGLSRLFPADATHVSTAPQGTPGYVDPEYHQCYQLTEKSDVYSYGVVLVELISSKPAVDVNRHRHEINLASMAINKIQNSELDQLIDRGLGYESDDDVKAKITQVAELAFRCLQTDREMRPHIKEVLEMLKAIESGSNRTAENPLAAECDGDNRNLDAPLLKDSGHYSPDSVTDNWVSTRSTSNTSN